MIERKHLLSIPFYKKTCFYGSWKGMHYRIQKEEKEEGACFEVVVWPGPYNMAKTPQEKWQKEEFTFSEEGLDEICAWLNQTYEKQIEIWKAVSMWD